MVMLADGISLDFAVGLATGAFCVFIGLMSARK